MSIWGELRFQSLTKLWTNPVSPLHPGCQVWGGYVHTEGGCHLSPAGEHHTTILHIIISKWCPKIRALSKKRKNMTGELSSYGMPTLAWGFQHLTIWSEMEKLTLTQLRAWKISTQIMCKKRSKSCKNKQKCKNVQLVGATQKCFDIWWFHMARVQLQLSK